MLLEQNDQGYGDGQSHDAGDATSQSDGQDETNVFIEREHINSSMSRWLIVDQFFGNTVQHGFDSGINFPVARLDPATSSH